jgi:succinoglycan biosynthesis protein ExoO
MPAVCASVSVIMPAFNAASFIERALGSALGQEGVEVEVIVADDGSSDGTADLVAELARREPRLRLVRLPENRGPSAARNAALDAAGSEWVAVLDADDAFTPGRLRRLTDLAAARGADIVADNFMSYDARSGTCGPPALALHAETETLTLSDYVERARAGRGEADYGLLQPVLRRSFLETHRLRYPERSRHGEDFLFLFFALLKGAVYVVSREPGYLYTTRSSGMSRTRVNYLAMAEETRALLLLPEVSQDARLQQLILERIAAIRQVHARWLVSDRWSARDAGGLLMAALKHREVAGEVWRRIRKQVGADRRSAAR